MPSGLPNPETRAAFTVAPDVVYSPIVPFWLVTNRSDPDTAMPHGTSNPEIRAAFTVAPDAVYSPIVPLKFATNRSDPDTAMPYGPSNPETRAEFTAAPEVVNSPIVLLPSSVTKIWLERSSLGSSGSNAASLFRSFNSLETTFPKFRRMVFILSFGASKKRMPRLAKGDCAKPAPCILQMSRQG